MKGKHKYVTDDSALHLGGNKLKGDPCTFCPSSWKYIFDRFEVKTAIDLGSGLGYAAQWMQEYGVTVLPVDGLDYNVENSLVPAIKHDLTTGPLMYQPVDFVNCIEVVEHIEEQYVDNLMKSLTLGTYALITHAVPGQKGWHHVNCQPSEYWIQKFADKGYELLDNESKEIQKLAEADGAKHIARNGMLFKKT